LPLRFEFAHFSIKNHRNFGVRVTSRAEGAHGLLKRLLKSRRIDLHTLLRAIEETLERLRANFEAHLHEQSSKKVLRYSDPVMAPLRYRVGFAALKLIAGQVDIANSFIRGDRPTTTCTRAFNFQYGLPCCHLIKRLKELGAQLNIKHLEPHWWLKKPVCLFDMLITMGD